MESLSIKAFYHRTCNKKIRRCTDYRSESSRLRAPVSSSRLRRGSKDEVAAPRFLNDHALLPQPSTSQLVLRSPKGQSFANQIAKSPAPDPPTLVPEPLTFQPSRTPPPTSEAAYVEDPLNFEHLTEHLESLHIPGAWPKESRLDHEGSLSETTQIAKTLSRPLPSLNDVKTHLEPGSDHSKPAHSHRILSVDRSQEIEDSYRKDDDDNFPSRAYLDNLRHLQTQRSIVVEAAKHAAAKALAKLEPPSIIRKLSSKQEHLLSSMLAVEDSSYQIQPNFLRHDLTSILPHKSGGTGLLNDEVVCGYLDALVRASLQKVGHVAGTTPLYHAFNSHMYTTYRNKGHDAKSVAGWLRRAKVSGRNLFSVKTVFIPINNMNHWTLLTISGTDRRISYYDSLGGGGERYFQFARAILKETLGNDYHPQEWTSEGRDSVMQRNGLDCGVFVGLNAHALLRGLEPHKAFAAEEIPDARRYIAALLASGGFLGDFAW